MTLENVLVVGNDAFKDDVSVSLNRVGLKPLFEENTSLVIDHINNSSISAIVLQEFFKWDQSFVASYSDFCNQVSFALSLSGDKKKLLGTGKPTFTGLLNKEFQNIKSRKPHLKMSFRDFRKGSYFSHQGYEVQLSPTENFDRTSKEIDKTIKSEPSYKLLEAECSQALLDFEPTFPIGSILASIAYNSRMPVVLFSQEGDKFKESYKDEFRPFSRKYLEQEGLIGYQQSLEESLVFAQDISLIHEKLTAQKCWHESQGKNISIPSNWNHMLTPTNAAFGVSRRDGQSFANALDFAKRLFPLKGRYGDFKWEISGHVEAGSFSCVSVDIDFKLFCQNPSLLGLVATNPYHGDVTIKKEMTFSYSDDVKNRFLEMTSFDLSL